MKTFFTLTIVQLFYTFSYAFIPPLEMVISKTAGLSARQTILFEQDVLFTDGHREATVREAWLMDGDRKLKMVAQGVGEYKERIRLVAIYKDGSRTTMVGKNKITEPVGRDFFERYLGIRSSESFNQLLTDFSISPQIRLSRAAGAIAFAIGSPSLPKEPGPQMWVKQDTFELLKLRTPSGAEFHFENFTSPEGQTWSYPKTKKIEWAGKSVLIKVKTIAPRPTTPATSFVPQLIENPSEISFAERDGLALTIEEFYKRFR